MLSTLLTLTAALAPLSSRDFASELVAVYDHRIWWSAAENKLTTARFDPAAFAAGLGDRSLTFETLDFGPLGSLPFGGLHLLGPAATARAPRVPGGPLYWGFLRSEGLLLDVIPLEGTSLILQEHAGYHLYEWGYGDYAWDLAKVDSEGLRFSGSGTQNEDYFVWDQPVYLPLDGTVAEIVRLAPDNMPGSIAGTQSNLVGVRVTGNYYLYLLHFEQGSIPASIQVGDFLPAGTYLGDVGNSGITYEPHLHMTLHWFDYESLRFWSVPTAFQDIRVASDGVNFETYEEVRPKAGSLVEKTP